MAWSIFTEGGGKGAAQTWAKDLLSAIGAPQSTENVQVIYDWEVSEGGGGKYNPLNQGAVPGHPELSSKTGAAADYVSWQAGLQGSVDYLNMSNFQSIKKALLAGDAAAARANIISSPWAGGHYGNGSSFSTAALPGQDTALPGISNASFDTGVSSSLAGTVGGGILDGILSALGISDLKDLAERAGLILVGTVLLVIGLLRVTGQDKLTLRVGEAVATKGGSEVAKAESETEKEAPKEEETKTAHSKEEFRSIRESGYTGKVRHDY